MPFGVTTTGFNLKRTNDILADMVAALNTVTDPISGETLTVDLADENDPFVQQVQVIADSLGLCWEQLQASYNQFDPLFASGNGLSGLVQLAGLDRLLGENDSVLRARFLQSSTAPARGMIDDCYAAILQIEGVTFCRIYQNMHTFEDVRGIPGKAIAAVVVGGDEVEIATALFNHHALCVCYGTTTVPPIVDEQGISYDIQFTRPEIIPIYVAVSCAITNAALWPSDGIDQIKQAIVNYATLGASAIGIPTGFDQVGISPGETVYATELALPVDSVPGVKAVTITVGISEESQGASVLIEWNQHATFDISRIVVTI